MKRITRISPALLLSCLPLLSGCINSGGAINFSGSGMVACVVSRLMECAPGGIPYGVKLAAEQGDADAQYQMGQAYDHGGKIVYTDSREAARWYRLAAEQGHADAQFKLGYMHHHGEGVAEDGKEALKWYRMAVEQGNAKAQYGLGMLYHEGFGVHVDHDESRKWFMMAAENLRTTAEDGDMDAQYLLGYAYEYGRGVTTDRKEALKWYQKAAEQGHTGGGVDLEYTLKQLRKDTEQDDAKASTI